MLYLIGGAAKAGKTIITRRLLRERNIPCFCIDYFVSALDQGAPVLQIDSESPNVIRAPQIWPILEPMLRNIIEVEPEYTVEGDALFPKGVKLLAEKYPGAVKACFLGYAETTPIEKLQKIRKFNGHINDWLQDKPDQYILDLSAEMIEFSRYVRDECRLHGLPYFDVSRDFAGALEQAYAVLTRERNR